MNRVEEIERKQQEIIQSISQIPTMIKGSINEVHNSNRRKDGTESRNGPYYILTRKDCDGKTVTRGINRSDIGFYREQADNYRRFNELAGQYAVLAEERLSLDPGSGAAEDARAKKNG